MAEQLGNGAQQGGLTDPLSARNTDTGSMKRLAAEQQQGTQARKTIKLKPLAPKKPGVNPSDLTTSAPAFPSAQPQPNGNEATVSMDRGDLEEQTQKLQKPSVAVATTSSAPAAPSLPGVKQTIKLRPSTGGSAEETQSQAAPSAKPASAQTIKLTPKSHSADPAAGEDEKTVAMAKQTIRLVPKKQEVTATTPSMPKPSDPTVNLQSSSSALKPSDPTVKLSPTQMSAAPGAGSADETVEGGAVQETKPKIGLKHQSVQPPPQATAPGAPPLEDAADSAGESSSKDEPSIIFTIAAAVAFVMIAYLSLLMFAQYNNHWMGGNMDVPGLSRLK